MRDRVDILTAPSRDTSRSNQGTVAASPTKKKSLKSHNNLIFNIKKWLDNVLQSYYVMSFKLTVMSFSIPMTIIVKQSPNNEIIPL